VELLLQHTHAAISASAYYLGSFHGLDVTAEMRNFNLISPVDPALIREDCLLGLVKRGKSTF
jgi:hypothetical protein